MNIARMQLMCSTTCVIIFGILNLCITSCAVCIVTQEKKFFYIGKLMAGALAQGGSGSPIFTPSLYSYMKGDDIDTIYVPIDEVPDYDIRNVTEKVSTFLLLGAHETFITCTTPLILMFRLMKHLMCPL